MAETQKALPVKTDERGVRRIGGIAEDLVQQMEAVVAEYGVDKLTAKPGEMFAPMLCMAEGMVRLRELLNEDVMKAVMVLQGSQLGFLTDKDKDGGYGLKEVKDAWIEATLMGARPIGNEFNIISRKAYLTLNNFKRKVRELPGLTDLDISLGLKAEAMKPGTIDVPYRAKWKLDGKPMQIEGTFPVRVNQGMGADAVLGKTNRKVLNLIWQKVTGSDHTLPEGDVMDCDIPGAIDAKASVLGSGRRRLGPPQKDKAAEPTVPLQKVEDPPAEKPAEEPAPEKPETWTLTQPRIDAILTAADRNGWSLEQMNVWLNEQYVTEDKSPMTIEKIESEMCYNEVLEHFSETVQA